MLELPSDKPRHSNCLTTKLGTHEFTAKTGTADKLRICRTPPFPTKSTEYRSESPAYSVFFNTEKVKLRRGLNNSTYSGAFNLFSWVSRSNPRGQLDRVVFPEITFEKGVPTGIDWSISLTKDSLVKALRHDLSQIGLDSKGYSGHSFRAGGATDLFTSGLLTLEQIMKVGRWRSISAALVYYRDELITATLAADAFGRSRRAGA